MRNFIQVDLKQIKRNLDEIEKALPKGCDVIAVVKANAYGHGDVPVVKFLEDYYGLHIFAVAGLDEALRLRAAGIKGDILVLSYISISDIETAIDNNITITIVGAEHAVAVSNEAVRLGKVVNVHIALNTGMNRIGFECKAFKQLMTIAGVYQLPGICCRGIFSHFSSSDDSSRGAEPYTKLQLDRFSKVLSYLSERGIRPGIKHIANSGAIDQYPKTYFDAVRCGALLYGYNTAPKTSISVVPVMQWVAEISQIREIEFGDAVSYSRKFVAKDKTKIATVCIGYADGLPRSLSNKGHVLIHGVKCPIVGNICMDQMMVDISEIKDEVKMGDYAVIIGRSGDIIQTADDLAAEAGTCMHDILSSIQARVKRVYLEA